MKIKKLVASVTAVLFLYTSVFSGALQAIADSGREKKEFKRVLDDSVIPTSAGRVTDCSLGSNDTIVVNVQDLHCHAEVQRNIAKVLESIDEKYPLKKIYVEGAAGDVDTSWLLGIRDEKLQRELTETLIDQGKLTGTEYFSVTSRKPDIISGIENKGVYKENFARLNLIVSKREYFRKVSASLRTDLDAMKGRYYSAQNLRFEKFINEYRTGKIEPRKYFKMLEKYVDKLNGSAYRFKNLSHIDVKRYGNVVLYLDLIETGEKLHYKRIGTGTSGLHDGTQEQIALCRVQPAA